MEDGNDALVDPSLAISIHRTRACLHTSKAEYPPLIVNREAYCETNAVPSEKVPKDLSSRQETVYAVFPSIMCWCVSECVFGSF